MVGLRQVNAHGAGAHREQEYGRGRVVLEGTELLGLPEVAMRDVRGGRAGMIFQEPATSLNPVMRIGQQIIEAIEAHTTLRGSAARARAIQWLTRVGIPDPERRVDDYPFQFSGGQKQRVMIAIALAAEPELLIADEPTTALDVTVQAQVLRLLADIQKDLGMAVLLITHDINMIRSHVDRLVLLKTRLYAAGPPAEVLKPEILSQVYGKNLVTTERDNIIVQDYHHYHH